MIPKLHIIKHIFKTPMNDDTVKEEVRRRALEPQPTAFPWVTDAVVHVL